MKSATAILCTIVVLFGLLSQVDAKKKPERRAVFPDDPVPARPALPIAQAFPAHVDPHSFARQPARYPVISPAPQWPPPSENPEFQPDYDITNVKPEGHCNNYFDVVFEEQWGTKECGCQKCPCGGHAVKATTGSTSTTITTTVTPRRK